MRDRTKLFSFALCAVLMLGLASIVQAQIQHTVSSNPNEVVQYGETELMGEFRLTVSSVPSVIGSTITITYQGVNITNASGVSTAINTAAAGGITVTGSANYAGVTYTSVASTGGGGQVIISVPNTVVPVAGDFIAINGVRADVSARSVNSDINAAISSSPSNANTFLNASILRVATVNSSLTITTTGVIRAICTTGSNPTINIKEGFAGGFVQYVISAAATPVPANARTTFGANANTQVNIVITDLPAGVTISWPTVVNSTATFAGPPPPPIFTSRLELLTGVNVATGATYEYTSSDQGLSDGIQEVFNITPVITVALTSSVGVSTAQGRLYPATGTTSVPRFNHPLGCGDPFGPNASCPFVTVTKCVTNLLFPFVANVAGFDTGVAIANTSYDVMAISPTTTTQQGPLNLYLYKSFAEPGPAPAPAVFTVANVSAGNTWAGTMSTIPQFAGSTGYLIAVAQFQFAHGFGFISFAPSAGNLVLAEGYTANVIPDVALTGNARAASPAATANSGENLGN
jgi:hypothetical protein